VLFHCLYLVPKEGDAAYDQQCDTILKPKNLWIQALLVTFEDKTFFQRIHEDLVNDFFATTVKNHRKNPLSDFDKFGFHDGLMYHDILLYVLERPHNFKFCMLNMTHWLLAILDSTRPRS